MTYLTEYGDRVTITDIVGDRAVFAVAQTGMTVETAAAESVFAAPANGPSVFIEPADFLALVRVAVQYVDGMAAGVADVLADVAAADLVIDVPITATDPDPFLCRGCGREELTCSQDPCPDVIADRGEDTKPTGDTARLYALPTGEVAAVQRLGMGEGWLAVWWANRADFDADLADGDEEFDRATVSVMDLATEAEALAELGDGAELLADAPEFAL